MTALGSGRGTSAPPSPEGESEDVSIDQDPEQRPAATFGRFRLLGRIGEGGMAEVYRAVMTGPEGFERELVLKRILPKLSETGEFKTMFIREAKISALLLHPNIVQIYEFGAAEGAYFIAMESVQGVTLREALIALRKCERAMPFMVAADITRQICAGLDYAHTLVGPDGAPLEIVHQDISPTNIMLAFNGTVKILDFGIARAASFAEEERKKGLIKGKVSYLSPEQVHARPFDCRADIFALGVVFHEMLTGRRLFQAKNDILKMRQLLAAPIPPPSAFNAAIPRELDRIVMRALDPSPELRYPSAAEMGGDLERTLIAARYSSRELSKVLHDLFRPARDEPLVIVEADDGPHTTTATGTLTSTGATTTGPTGTATATNANTNTSTEVLPGRNGRRTRSDPENAGLERALEAERGRLAFARWRARAKWVAAAVVGAALITGASVAGKRYWPRLFPPRETPAIAANQTGAATVVAPSATPPPSTGVVSGRPAKKRGANKRAGTRPPALSPSSSVAAPPSGAETAP